MTEEKKIYTEIEYHPVDEWLRQLRGFERRGDSGKRFNKPFLYIRRIERGDVRPSPEFRFDLCLEYDMPFEWLITGEEPKKRAAGETACTPAFFKRSS